jgi:hypothetical protein
MQKLSAKFRASHLEYNKKAAKLIDVIRIQQDWVSAQVTIYVYSFLNAVTCNSLLVDAHRTLVVIDNTVAL